jgi:hypothetical protein
MRSVILKFLCVVGRIDFIADNATFFLQVLQINMVGNRHMVGRAFKQLFLRKYTFMLGLFFLLNGRPTEQVGIDILCQGLVGDIFHIGVKSLKFFELVSENTLSHPSYVRNRAGLSQAIETCL